LAFPSRSDWSTFAGSPSVVRKIPF
ncbi:unnamed protein product, partial [Allacma fusca]